MSFVIGPNGRKNFVPDEVADSLVGNGERGWRHAPEPEPVPAKPAPARTPRKTTAK